MRVNLTCSWLELRLFQDTLYTYNPAYHHSCTFVPVNVDELKRKERIAHRQKFVSKKDWVYPEVKTLRQCNEHPKKPDAARCDALTKVSYQLRSHVDVPFLFVFSLIVKFVIILNSSLNTVVLSVTRW